MKMKGIDQPDFSNSSPHKITGKGGYNTKPQIFKKNIIRTSYYGKNDSESYHDGESNEREGEEFYLAVLGDMMLLK